MPACPIVPADPGFVRGVVDYIDCQAQAIGGGGYQALAAPGSTFSIVLTALLTLFVALFGYRMLFGATPGARDGVLALAKVGIVLALATGWPAYRTLVYDVAFSGPAELASDIGGPTGLPGAGGGLVTRLDFADQALVALAVVGPGDPALALQQAQAGAAGQPALPAFAPQPFGGFNTFALGGARMTFLLGALGALGAVRLVAGLMLALGPFFIAFLLFDGTRGLFEGWVRVLAGAALGALGSAVALGVELALLEPWLADLLARRYAGEAVPGAPVELLVVTLAFGLILIALLAASARLALGFRLGTSWRPTKAGASPRAVRAEESRRPAAVVGDGTVRIDSRSRAAAVVDAVAASQRREAALAPAAQAALVNRMDAPGRAPVSAAAAAAPFGQSFRRRTRARISVTAGRRDRSA